MNESTVPAEAKTGATSNFLSAPNRPDTTRKIVFRKVNKHLRNDYPILLYAVIFGLFGTFCNNIVSGNFLSVLSLVVFLNLFFFGWFRIEAKHNAAMANALLVSFLLPFSIITTCLSAYYYLDGEHNLQYGFIQKIASYAVNFVSDPIGEFYAIIGITFALVLFYVPLIAAQAIIGLPSSPSQWPNVALQCFALLRCDPPQRSPGFLYLKLVSAISAKSFFAYSGAIFSILLVGEIFPNAREGLGAWTTTMFLGNIIFVTSFCGMGTFIETCSKVVELSLTRCWDTEISSVGEVEAGGIEEPLIGARGS